MDSMDIMDSIDSDMDMDMDTDSTDSIHDIYCTQCIQTDRN